MADADKNWWTTVPGLLTALAAIITAVGGLVAALSQAGMFGGKSGEPAATAAPLPAAVEASTAPEPTPAAPAAAPIAPPVVAAAAPAALKVVRVTTKDGSVVDLRPTATILGSTIPLQSGQEVPFEHIERIDITQPWDGTLKLALVGGRSMEATAPNLPLSGSTELGNYLKMMSDIRRVEFVR
ncbi:MAG TPA: hypothetical protein VLI72_04120 [Methylibium sp.]|nr:hypothetical protein [Methylibium sp.]